MPPRSEQATDPVPSYTRANRSVRPEFHGVFSPYRAGTLAGVSGRRIGQWARYGLIRPSVYKGRPANRYAFYDVAEAIVVHWLIEEGFGLGEVHRAIDHARSNYPEWPLLEAPLGVARAVAGDRGAIVENVGGAYLETGRPGEQAVLRPEFLEYARDMLHAGGWLAYKLHLERIEVDPEKLGGAPTLRGRRWPVERVARIAADAEGRAILTDDYGLDERDVEESLRWSEAAAAL
jgi:uncharacterized protein (DUF433 family)